jgi:carbon monoxide dehydrogenase subunit G
MGERDGVRRMTVVSVALEVDAPPERVWEVISNPRNLPHWQRHITRVTGVPKSGLGEGASYTVDLRFLAVRAKIRARVLEWEPPRRVSVQLGGVLDGSVTSTVEPVGRNRSRLEHVVDYRFRGGPLGAVAARSLRTLGGARYVLRNGTLAQKREIETGAAG